MDNPIKISPSDLTFLWDECKRCFYLKYRFNFKRPFGPMPGIFSTIDLLMKNYFMGKSTKDIEASLPPGLVSYGEKWVESKPITVPNRLSSCFIRGKFDTVVSFDDGSFGVVDFKTSTPKPYHIPFYGRQLHAYRYALENPAPKRFHLSPITKLGLLVVTPDKLVETSPGKLAYEGNVTWLEIPNQEDEFFQFIDQVLSVLDLQSPPEAGEKCPYCRYRIEAREHSF